MLHSSSVAMGIMLTCGGERAGWEVCVPGDEKGDRDAGVGALCEVWAGAEVDGERGGRAGGPSEDIWVRASDGRRRPSPIAVFGGDFREKSFER